MKIPKTHVKRLSLIALLTLLLPVLAACGGSPPATTGPGGAPTTAPQATTAPQTTTEPASEATSGGGSAAAGGCANTEATRLVEQVRDMPAKEREQLLLKRAVEEEDGEVVFYGELQLDQAGPIIDAFEEKYEGMTVQYYRAPSDQIRQRILEEARANFRGGADLLELEGLEMVILTQEGLLAPASSAHEEDLYEAGRFETFLADRFAHIVPAWNPKKLSKAELPQKFEDFADPKYKGTLVLEDSDVYWFAVMVNHLQETEGMSKDEAVDLFRKIAANSTVSHGHTTVAELLAAGQYGLSPNMYAHRISLMKEEGAPVEWRPPKAAPVVAEVTGVATMCRAENPAGALLLLDFILSPDGGQKTLVEMKRSPGSKKVATEEYAGIEPISGDIEEIVGEYEEWSSLWEEVLRSGQ